MSRVLVINGPNLNLLGQREPALYGSATLAEVEDRCRAVAEEYGWRLDFRQSNHEGELVDWIQQAGADQRDGDVIGAVLNPGAYGHTSVALHDAIIGSWLRVIEVHVSNVHQREGFRHHSYISPVAAGVIIGLGITGYALALRALRELSLAGR